tara:strand:- start:775 stop:876 length:102 start_codon:yes stop_codon:yes gene_type:complete
MTSSKMMDELSQGLVPVVGLVVDGVDFEMKVTH